MKAYHKSLKKRKKSTRYISKKKNGNTMVNKYEEKPLTTGGMNLSVKQKMVYTEDTFFGKSLECDLYIEFWNLIN